MLKNYYNLILKKLQELAEENKLGYIDKDNILDDPQLNSLIHSVSYVAENIDKQILESESNVYKLIISKVYSFIFKIKPSNIIISFEPKSYDIKTVLNKNTDIQIYSNEKKYTYTILSRIEFLQIQILESQFIQYNTILNNNYFGTYFLSIKIQIFSQTKDLNKKNIRFYVLHENYEEILTSILSENKPVYVYFNNNLLQIGVIKINNYYSLQKEFDIPRQYDYLFQYLINKQLFAFINIYIDSNSIEKILGNTKIFTIIIPSNNIYSHKDILRYYVAPAYNYNIRDTNSFYIDNGFEKIIHLDHEENLDEAIVSVLQLFSINKNTRSKCLYLPEYFSYNSDIDCLINTSIKWDYENFFRNNKHLTKIILIPDNQFSLQNLEEQIYYAKVYYTQIIKFIFIANKILILQAKNIKDIYILSGPTKTVFYSDNILQDHLLAISKININSIEIFKNQMKNLLNILFKTFKKDLKAENIIEDIIVTFKDYNKKYFLEFILAENYSVSIGLLISIIYFINNYFDISYSFNYKFTKKYSNYSVL